MHIQMRIIEIRCHLFRLSKTTSVAQVHMTDVDITIKPHPGGRGGGGGGKEECFC